MTTGLACRAMQMSPEGSIMPLHETVQDVTILAFLLSFCVSILLSQRIFEIKLEKYTRRP